MQNWTRFTTLVLFGVAAGFAASHDCKTSDFAGKYAFQSFGYDVRSQPPSPQAISGILEPDGAGGFLSWDQAVAFLGQPGPAKVVVHSNLLEDAKAAGSELRYEVTPNCQMRIFGSIQTPLGPTPVNLVGGLADGGRKALLQLGAPFAIGTWTAQRAERITRRLSESSRVPYWRCEP